MLVFLPQVSFGENPELTAFNEQQGSESSAFWQQQAQERGAFMNANPDIIAKHDQRFEELLAISMAQRTGKSTAGLPNPPDEDSTFSAFVAKQQSDKEAFLAKLAHDRQNFLNSHPGAI